MRSYFVHLNKLYLRQALKKKKHYNFSPFLLQQRKVSLFDILPELQKIHFLDPHSQFETQHTLIPYYFIYQWIYDVVHLVCELIFTLMLTPQLISVVAESFWHNQFFLLPFGRTHAQKSPGNGESRKRVKESWPIGNAKIAADWLNQLPIKHNRLVTFPHYLF